MLYQIASLADCFPVKSELLSLLNHHATAEDTGDLLSESILEWSSELFSLDRNGAEEELFLKIKEAFSRLKTEILVSSINPDQVPIALKEPIIVGDLTLLTVQGPRHEYRKETLAGLPLVWEKNVLDAFQIGYDTYFSADEALPLQRRVHAFATAMIDLSKRVHFTPEEIELEYTMTPEAIAVLERLGTSSLPLIGRKKRELALEILNMSLAIDAATYQTLCTRRQRVWQTAASFEEKMAQLLAQEGARRQYDGLQRALEHEQHIEESLAKMVQSYEISRGLLEEQVEREKEEEQKTEQECEEVKLEISILGTRSDQLSNQIRAEHQVLAQRKREIDAETDRQANESFCLLL